MLLPRARNRREALVALVLQARVGAEQHPYDHRVPARARTHERRVAVELDGEGVAADGDVGLRDRGGS
eukprot:3262461-Prymnesium_polylepis.1